MLLLLALIAIVFFVFFSIFAVLLAIRFIAYGIMSWLVFDKVDRIFFNKYK